MSAARGRGRGDGLMRIAVPKGALFEDSVSALAAAGLDVACLASPGRQLIVSGSDAEFIIAKPTDVPVYVAYGAADCGIAGRDVLIEADLGVVELLDLGFGGCRFVVAGPADDDDLAKRYAQVGVLRVATKYPRITAAHYAERGVQVEIVKLHGNIELAPLIGISDVIVDITATGTTLRDNGLRVIEDVLPSTARFVANSVAVRTDLRVLGLASGLSAGSVQSEADTSAAPPSAAAFTAKNRG